jgi:hypothetical protein
MTGTRYCFPIPRFHLSLARRVCAEKEYIVDLGHCELDRPGLSVQEAPLRLDFGRSFIKRGRNGKT